MGIGGRFSTLSVSLVLTMITVIQSAIEQAKLKFNIHTKSTDSDGARTRDADFLSDSVTESLAEMSELEETLANEKTTSGNSRSILSYIYIQASFWLIYFQNSPLERALIGHFNTVIA